ncbi:hypothetical protein ACIRQQ_03020 [Streptomyces fuscichromogenes]|uniref:hypothetical protein n=1 Tax=Streptomyces fuscichromogenes TaxID=1324013 RepID=UPI0038079BCC
MPASTRPSHTRSRTRGSSEKPTPVAAHGVALPATTTPVAAKAPIHSCLGGRG